MNRNTRENPIVSVVVLNWNGKEHLEDCLASLQAQSFIDFETLLVDNGSTDDSVQYVEENFADMVRVIALPENRGFAGGNNVGIALSRGKYIALLNNDTEVGRDWLKYLVACLEGNERTGMVGSKILNFYRRGEIDNTGHLMYPDGLNRGRGRLEEDHGQYDDRLDILFPSGCAALYRKAMLDEIGGFDETFFAYGDDADIGLHGRLLGYGALYCPQAIVYHKYSKTTGRYSPMKAFYVERNRIWILLKYFPISFVLASPYHTARRFSLQFYGILTKKGAANRFVRDRSIQALLKTALQACSSALMGLPRALRQRRTILKKSKISKSQIRRLLRDHRISCREISLKD